MELKRINNFLVVFIILCSTSFYHFTFLGPISKVAGYLGVGLMLVLLLFNFVYGNRKSMPRHFTWPISLIIFSLFTSMIMAITFRNQGLVDTLMAQNALYFYLFYFLLHQLKIRPEDLEKIFIAFGLVFVALYMVQFVLYPKIIYDAYIRESRGTIRIYMEGACFLSIAFYISAQYFLRTNRFKYLVLILVIFATIVMNGGRQPMAVFTLMLIIFLILDRKVKSRLFLVFLGIVGAFAVFLIFQGIFQALILQSQSDASQGADYVRFRAIKFYLTQFYQQPMAYIFGNGAFEPSSEYGKLIHYNGLKHRYYLGDIGLVGNYVIYGAFFLLGVISITIRSLRTKIESKFIYIRYTMVAIIISLLTSGAFIQPDYIILFCCLFYLIDLSSFSLKENKDAIANN